jgi:hypothetical protein
LSTVIDCYGRASQGWGDEIDVLKLPLRVKSGHHTNAAEVRFVPRADNTIIDGFDLRRLQHVRYGSLADILTCRRHVRFTPNNGRWAAHPTQHLAVGL